VEAYRKKVDLQAARLRKDSEIEDPDLSFFKGLLPDVKKAQNKRKLKRKITELIDEFLKTEALISKEFT
jgi:hypothetical protein